MSEIYGVAGMEVAGVEKEGGGRSWAIRVNRVVVLQWLRCDEEQTGTNLADALVRADPNTAIEVINCRCKEDVIAAVDRLASEVGEKGNPVLHIEAHGYDYEGVPIGFSGPSASGEKEVLVWKVLIPHIRMLNIATGFNLVAVAAACSSDNLVYEVSLDRALPFLLLLGFNDDVRPYDLQATLNAFYSALLQKRLSPGQAFELADKATAGDAGFSSLSMLRIIVNAVEVVVRQDHDDHFDEDRYQIVLEETAAARGGRELTREQYVAMGRHFTESAVQTVLGRLLAVEVLPNNLQRFGMEAKRLIDEARQRLANR
jgi:hypothetical protein